MSEKSWVADMAPKDGESQASTEASLTAETDHDDESASSSGKDTAGQENEQESVKTEAIAPPKPSVRFWWEIFHGAEAGFSVEYLLDHSVRWSKNPYETVLRPQDTESSKEELELEDKIDIIGQIAAVFKQACPEAANQQPHVYFKGNHVCVELGIPAFLEALWRANICFKGKRLEIISKGLKGGDFRVFKVSGLQAGKLRDCKKTLKSCDWIFVVACVYEVDSLGGGPIFSGDLIVFTTGNMYELWGRQCFHANRSA
ncbi:hypothetical protein PANT_6d00034 [Moesziomyces antarcticus T-34]|uniref:Uncharacterized protein n=1 Tax=Pseudozyma antarctica (strain T-34) TaxID=1151754 RepID=M9LYA4_PSEA3|nr:hypothetical protein PANT_6d00034 [Moesziomyces antarcticus T-34]